jgi:hypothetical protein
VVDKGTGKIAAVVEDRRTKDGETAATLVVIGLNFDSTKGTTYEFLILMGYWDRDDKNGETYLYDPNSPPTLLAAGLQEQVIKGSTTVRVTMWPIVVDTEFTSKSLPSVPAAVNTAASLSLVEGKSGPSTGR